MAKSALSLESELDLLLSEDLQSVEGREKTDFDRKASPFEKSIILVGAGNLGRQVLSCLRNDGIEPLAFADNNPGLHGRYIDGVKVLSRKQAAEKYHSSAAFVITIWNPEHSYIQTREELTRMNCQKIISAIPLRWKYAKSLLPFYWLDVPSKTVINSDLIKSAFALWDDEFSRIEYLAQLKFRILGEFDTLARPVMQQSYFPEDLYNLLPNEKFVDCGAFTGTTIKNFLERQDKFMGNIVAYEPDPLNFLPLKQYIAQLSSCLTEKIILMPYAVGAHKRKVHFDSTGTMASSISINGKQEVKCIKLDENLHMLNIQPTYIKMDIEGGEMDALNGAQSIIQRNMPVLAVCLYHRYDDLWRIPLFIKSIWSEYNLYLRPHEVEGWQLVCYAVPTCRVKK